MPTPVPAVDRAVAILNYLADEPSHARTLTEISAALAIHPATCSATLACLQSHNLVRRAERRRGFLLGTALTRLGSAAGRTHSGFLAAREAVFALAQRFGCGGLVCAREGEDMVVLDMFGDVEPEHLPTRIGRRVPLAPPLGTVFYAWASPEEIAEWLARLDTGERARRDVSIEALAAVRARGYSLGGEHDLDVGLDSVLAKLTRADASPRMIEVAMEVADLVRARTPPAAPGDQTVANFVIAPVFEPTGAPVLACTLFGRPGQFVGDQISAIAKALVEATNAIGGQLREQVMAG
ncbi:helix-turn-helix domain-containing protein [Dactylosporangium roseum]|uniref:Helix-turn-helix domain-containing protein n=1 Tax=Dactylosporangium roseum TaxID=47989 RepID=A0ABY5YXF5_9ACTN|nr:helix-turn-helix domain-containing protein [Dactylosporangium roseum]UWZ34436.1 helix-turn-helix domain-containing protein [Dactylosporangium roseum]